MTIDMALVIILTVLLVLTCGFCASTFFLTLKRTSSKERVRLEQVLQEDFRQEQEVLTKVTRELREDHASRAKDLIDTVVKTMAELGRSVNDGLQGTAQQLKALSESMQTQLDRHRGAVDIGLQSVSNATLKSLEEISRLQKNQLELLVSQIQGLTTTTETRIESLRKGVNEQLERIRADNEKKLEQIRTTVDEKLQQTLERRLVQSFKAVQDNLESVQRGLGEMRTLALGVGDLKKVLTNVKTRGTWGEVQLGAILEQILTPDQYEKNVKTKEAGSESVEYAVKLPGRDNQPETIVWLPIDSKFPQEDYGRLVEASEAGDIDAVQKATLALGRSARNAAQQIREKYLNPPKTTDFAIMFLPTEGLYAEVLRQTDLSSELQRTYRIVPAGPTTLAAILSSLRMGFQTLAIEKRSSEVWKILGAVKTEFAKFGSAIQKVKRKLEEAAKTVDDTDVRARVMQRRLREVEQLPPGSAEAVLQLDEAKDAIEASEELESGENADVPF